VMCIVNGHKLQIVDLYAEKIGSDHGVKAHAYAVKHNTQTTFFETNTFQLYAKHEFDRLLPRKYAVGIEHTKNKELRLDELEPFFRAADIWYSSDLVGRKEFKMFQKEYEGYPLVADNHLLDALHMVVERTIATFSHTPGGTSVEAAPEIETYTSAFDSTEIGR